MIMAGGGEKEVRRMEQEERPPVDAPPPELQGLRLGVVMTGCAE